MSGGIEQHSLAPCPLPAAPKAKMQDHGPQPNLATWMDRFHASNTFFVTGLSGEN